MFENNSRICAKHSLIEQGGVCMYVHYCHIYGIGVKFIRNLHCTKYQQNQIQK